MLIFDVGNRDVCTVRRQSTDTPLQALVLLNATQYQEASRKLAEQIMRENQDLDRQIEQLFQRVFGRAPLATELNHVRSYYKTEKKVFTENKEKATAYLSLGEAPHDPQLDPAALSALSLCANALLNTYEGSIIQ